VPGYESVGRVRAHSDLTAHLDGRRVFVPGARCYGAISGLFGGAASRMVVPAARVLSVDEDLDEQGILLALAATAYHVTRGDPAAQPGLIVGHGVLGRLLARIAIAVGAVPPTVWEIAPGRRAGASGYRVCAPDADAGAVYARICDASGDANVIDRLMSQLGRGGEIALAGFYSRPLNFAFPPAFMREARLRVCAEWEPADLTGVRDLVACGALSLDGLVTHRFPATAAADAYRTAFDDPECLKMILDWRACA